MKRIPLIALFAAVSATAFCCYSTTVNAQDKKTATKNGAPGTATAKGKKTTGGFKKIDGLEYKIIKDVPGKNAAIGDVIELNMLSKVGDDVLKDTWKEGKPGAAKIEAVKNLGDLMAVFPFLSAGDSAIVTVSCDTILKTVPPDQMGKLPPWLKKGNKITMYISVISVKPIEEYQKEMQVKQAEMEKEMQAHAGQQAPIDDKILRDYFAKNNITPQKTASGLYYTITKEGTGEKAKSGQKVSMSYLGKTLDGKKFDANVDENFHNIKPFSFTLGVGQVIKGWDEGVALLSKGGKATFYIPSSLAYGPQAMGGAIPANSNLIFDVEVLDIN